MRPFEEWDRLTQTAQMWIALHTMIQEAFQRCLNVTAPMAGHHGYAPAPAFCHNAFGALGAKEMDDKPVEESVATQVAALAYQSQLTANTATTTSIRQEQQMVHLAAQQQVMHENMHQLIVGLNAVTFNQHDKGRGMGRFSAHGYSGGYGGNGGQARGRGGCSFCGRGRVSPTIGYPPMASFPHNSVGQQGFPLGIPPPPGGIQAYRSPIGGQFRPAKPGGPPPIAIVQAPPYLNTVKRYAN